MADKRRRPFRRYFRSRARPRRRTGRKIPILTATVVAGHMLDSASKSGLYRDGQLDLTPDTFVDFGDQILQKFTGVSISPRNPWGGFHWDMMQPIYTLGSLAVAHFGGKLANRWTGHLLDRMPIVGKYLKW